MHNIDINRMYVSDITDTEGAAIILAERFKREKVSVDSIHRFVRDGLLSAWMFQQGQLVRRDPGQPTQGKDLIFLKAELHAMTPPHRGNPNIANLHKSRKREKISGKNP